jgi:hypothetical protein
MRPALQNQDAAGYPDRQPYDIDKRITLLVNNIAQGNLQVALKHIGSLSMKTLRIHSE